MAKYRLLKEGVDSYLNEAFGGIICDKGMVIGVTGLGMKNDKINEDEQSNIVNEDKYDDDLANKIKQVGLKYNSGEIVTNDGMSLVRMNRESGTTPLTPVERDTLIKLIGNLLTKHFNL